MRDKLSWSNRTRTVAVRSFYRWFQQVAWMEPFVQLFHRPELYEQWTCDDWIINFSNSSQRWQTVCVCALCFFTPANQRKKFYEHLCYLLAVQFRCGWKVGDCVMNVRRSWCKRFGRRFGIVDFPGKPGKGFDSVSHFVGESFHHWWCCSRWKVCQ